jgi:hypothetical protein
MTEARQETPGDTPSFAVRRILERFPDAVIGTHAWRGDDTVTLRREAIVDACRFLKEQPDLACNLFVDLTAVDHLPRVPRFEVVIHLYAIPHKHRIRLKVPLEESDPSWTPSPRGRDRLVRARGLGHVRTVPRAPDPARAAVRGLRGASAAEGLPDRPAAAPDRAEELTVAPHPLEPETDFHTQPMVLNLGPSHPMTHGTVRILATLEGETLLDADVEIGYLHRAFEKSCEHGTWQQAFPYTDRLNYNSAIVNNVCYAMGVEKLLGVEVPERCQFIRTVASEIARIADHLTCIGPSSMEVGAFSTFLYFVEARELMWDLIESLCGARLTNNYIRIGGVKADLPDDSGARVAGSGRGSSYRRGQALTRNRIFVDRCAARADPAEDATTELTGPCCATGA